MLRAFGIQDKVCCYSIDCCGAYRFIQLGHVTTDSASSNVVMVRNLGVNLPEFPGTVNHVRCMDHAVSLSGKSVLCLFDIAEDGKDKTTMDAAEQALAELAEGLEIEEATHRVLADEPEEDPLRSDDDVGDSMREITASMSPEELEEFRASALPVRAVLVKVRFNTCWQARRS